MDRQQTMKILSVLKAAYPHAFQNMSKADGEAMMSLWSTMFAGDSYEEVNAAVASLISTRVEGYSPTVGEVKEEIRKLHHRADIDDNGAWVLVSRACRNGSYHSQEEFAKLPPDIQQVVGSPEQLKAWAAMEADVVESVIASNFKKAYRVHLGRQAEVEKLPPQVRDMIGGISEKFMMIGGAKQ